MRCKRCLNDRSVRKISFDDEGICNYCRNYETIKDKVEDDAFRKRLFQERIERVKGRHRYDAAVGISGGKDSAYVLYKLVHTYRLRVKAFTMDNGFLSEEAVRNIDNLVKELQVEHEYITFDKKLLQKGYHYSMSHWLVPCIACSYIGYAAMIGYANKIDAGMCVHGRSPEQMLRYYGEDVFSALVDLGLKSMEDVDLEVSYVNLINSVKDKVDEGIYRDIRDIAFGGEDHICFREFVPYFLYHEYDEGDIVAYLKKQTNWNPPRDYNHYDCEIHNAAKYIYQCAEGRPHRLPEISALIRMGALSGEEGRKLLEQEVISEKPKEELKALCGFAKINQTVLFSKAMIYNKVIKR